MQDHVVGVNQHTGRPLDFQRILMLLLVGGDFLERTSEERAAQAFCLHRALYPPEGQRQVGHVRPVPGPWFRLKDTMGFVQGIEQLGQMLDRFRASQKKVSTGLE